MGIAEKIDDFVDIHSVPKHRVFRSHPFLDRLNKAIDYDFVTISGLDMDGFRFGSGQSLDTNAPPALVEAYFAEELHKTDPIALAMQTAKGVVIEKEVYANHPPPERLAYLSKIFGCHNRTAFPLIRGDVVYASVCFSRKKPFDADEIRFLENIALSVYTVIAAPLTKRFSADVLKLSSGEVACLKLASNGYTSEEIAAKSGYQTDTVNSYIKKAARKLQARNRLHAVVDAMRRGLFQ